MEEEIIRLRRMIDIRFLSLKCNRARGSRRRESSAGPRPVTPWAGSQVHKVSAGGSVPTISSARETTLEVRPAVCRLGDGKAPVRPSAHRAYTRLARTGIEGGNGEQDAGAVTSHRLEQRGSPIALVSASGLASF